MTNDIVSHTAFVHDTMASVSGTQFVTTYTDSDTDNDTDSDVDASDDELDVTTAKRARTTDTPPDYSGSPRAAKRPRTDDDEPPRAHSPTAVIGADASTDSESSESSDSESDSGSDSGSDESGEEEASDAGDGEKKSYSEGQAPVAVVDTTTRCLHRGNTDARPKGEAILAADSRRSAPEHSVRNRQQARGVEGGHRARVVGRRKNATREPKTTFVVLDGLILNIKFSL